MAVYHIPTVPSYTSGFSARFVPWFWRLVSVRGSSSWAFTIHVPIHIDEKCVTLEVPGKLNLGLLIYEVISMIFCSIRIGVNSAFLVSIINTQAFGAYSAANTSGGSLYFIMTSPHLISGLHPWGLSCSPALTRINNSWLKNRPLNIAFWLLMPSETLSPHSQIPSVSSGTIPASHKMLKSSLTQTLLSRVHPQPGCYLWGMRILLHYYIVGIYTYRWLILQNLRKIP